MVNRSKKVRLKDIARETGYSVTTVAKVLSGSAKETRISDVTAAEILATAKKLGYVPNIMARNLRAQRSGLIGIHLATADDTIIASTMTAILKNLPSLGYAPILTVEETSSDRCFDTWVRNDVEGILFCGPSRNLTQPLFEKLKSGNIPAVIAGNPYRSPLKALNSSVIPIVQIDNRMGIRLAIDHLKQRNRTCIAFISGPDWHSDADERRTSYEECITSLHDPIVAAIESTNLYWQRGYLSAKLIVDTYKECDAIIAYDDNVALGAMKFLADNGIAIPDDIAVVGFDNQPQAEYSIPSLTSINQPADEIGGQSLNLLLSIMKGSQVSSRRLLVEPTLVIRESTGRTDLEKREKDM